MVKAGMDRMMRCAPTSYPQFWLVITPSLVVQSPFRSYILIEAKKHCWPFSPGCFCFNLNHGHACCIWCHHMSPTFLSSLLINIKRAGTWICIIPFIWRISPILFFPNSEPVAARTIRDCTGGHERVPLTVGGSYFVAVFTCGFLQNVVAPKVNS